MPSLKPGMITVVPLPGSRRLTKSSPRPTVKLFLPRRTSCVNPAVPLVRSSFEAVLAMEYILEADYRRRAFAWMVGYAHARLHSYERFDPSTTKGKGFADAVAK